MVYTLKSKIAAAAVMFLLSGMIIFLGKCMPGSEEDSVETSGNIPDNTVAVTDGGDGGGAKEIRKPDADRIIEYSQYPEYPTGCESVSLYILLKYYGVDVTVGDIVSALPKGPVPYGIFEVYGADPYTEFVGDPADERSYGVYNGPIRDVAEKFKPGAVAENLGDGTAEGIRKALEDVINGGSPLIVWMRRAGSEGEVYWKNEDETSERSEICWLKGEHALVVYDFDDGGYYCSDPMEGEKTYIEREEFLTALQWFDGMCVYYP